MSTTLVDGDGLDFVSNIQNVCLGELSSFLFFKWRKLQVLMASQCVHNSIQFTIDSLIPTHDQFFYLYTVLRAYT